MSKEDIAAIVMMPAVLREIWKNPDSVEDVEAALKTCESYTEDLDKFALDPQERDDAFYDRFRKLLNTYVLIFQRDYEQLEFASNDELAYALEQVKEARTEHADQHKVLKFD